MLRIATILVLSVSGLCAQVRTLTLREVIELALNRNPDIALARLDERKAADGVRLARASFIPTVGAGSGLAYSNGFPQSIEGATPSIIQARAAGTIFNREKSLLVAQARENVRGSSIGTEARQLDVVHRAACLFLDAERAARSAEAARKQAASLEQVAEIVQLQVQEGRELQVAMKEAQLNLAKARQTVQSLEAAQEFAESSLALLLGFSPNERVRAVQQERDLPSLSSDEEELVKSALESNRELRRLESALAAKGFEISSVRAQRLPQVDLVAQYAVLGRFNNYEDFFRKFQRHNGQLGVAFRIPLFAGAAVEARTSQAEAEAAQLRIRIRTLRDSIALDTRRLILEVRRAETARQVERLELEVARERLSILLAQMEEGRATLRDVEQARFEEDRRWIAFLEGRYAEEKARLDLLHHTGGLLAALR